MRLQRLTPCFIVLLALGCAPSNSDSDAGTPDAGDAGSDAAPPGPEWKAGSRLQPVLLKGGTVQRFETFHDTVLDADCTFSLREDGKLHCVPVPLAQAQNVYAELVYPDAACKGTPVTAGIRGCSVPTKFAMVTNESPLACGAFPVVELGAAEPAPSAGYVKSYGQCYQVSTLGSTYYALTRTLAASDLVSATVSRTPVGSQLAVAYTDGEDGSRGPLQLENQSPYGGACQPRTVDTGSSIYCVPTRAATMGYTSGAGCSGPPAALYADDCGGAPVIAASYNPNVAFAAIGAKLSGPVSIYRQGQGCVSGGPGDVYAVGASLPVTTFGGLATVTTDDTPLALREHHIQPNATTRIGIPRFWDAVHKLNCAPALAGDGKVRCLPYVWLKIPDTKWDEASSPVFRPFYSDAACTTPIIPAGPYPTVNDPIYVPPFVAYRPGSETCYANPARVLAPTSKLAKPSTVYERDELAVCKVFTLAQYVAEWYGAVEVPASEFTEMQRIVVQ